MRTFLYLVLSLAACVHGQDFYDVIKKRCYPADSCFPQQEDLALLQSNLTGRVLLPHMDEYNNKTIMRNVWTTKYPAVIVVVKSVDDVRISMLFAERFNLHVTILSSGHDYIGRSTWGGSFMINLSELKGMSVKLDSDRHQAGEITVHAGNNWGEIYEEVDKHDRVVLGGSIKSISVSGFTLGGGHSPISRSLGLAVDNVLEMTVVLADGKMAKCTENTTVITALDGTETTYNDGDLFWALRGGGNAAYGVVVTFTLKLHPAPSQVVSATITFPMKMTIAGMPGINYGYNVLNRMNSFIENLPREWGGYVVFGNTRFSLPGIDVVGTFSVSLNKFGPWDADTESTLNTYLSINASERIFYSIENKTSFLDFINGLYIPHSNRIYSTGTFLQLDSLNQTFSNFIMEELIIDNPDQTINNCYGVILGGKIADAAIDSAPLHPGFRTSSLWLGCVITMAESSEDFWTAALTDSHWITRGNRFSEKLMKFGSGQYINEQTRDNPNWKLDLFERHYPRLMLTKFRYDRHNFLTCWHCVGSDVDLEKYASSSSRLGFSMISVTCFFFTGILFLS